MPSSRFAFTGSGDRSWAGMVSPEPPPRRTDDARAADDAALAQHAAALADAIERVVPMWIEGLVLERISGWSGHVSPEIAAAAVAAGAAASDEVMGPMRALLAADIDDQRQNPMALLRAVTHHADAVLADAGMPTSPRDQFAERSFPDDRYGLVPMAWLDIDDSLHPLGITWGAAKAYVFKARRRDEGRT